MSAVCAVVQPDKVHLMADAAFYDDQGVVLHFTSKIRGVPGANAVFASRGPDVCFQMFRIACIRVGVSGFDDFKCKQPEIFEVFETTMEAIAPDEAYEILIAGWSTANDCGEVIYRRGHDLFQGPSMLELDSGVSYLLKAGAGLGVDTDVLADDFDPIVHGLPAFERSRSEKCDIACGKTDTPVMVNCIGGHVDHAVVTADGVEVTQLLKWPDVVGEKIAA